MIAMNRLLETCGAAASALALAGCISIPPDRHPVAERDLALAQHAADITLARDAWPAANWWTEYGDPQLDALIAQALRSNPTLDVARARIEAADAALNAQRAQGGGQAALDAGLNRQRYSANGLFPQPIGGNYFNDASVKLRAGYDFDWWGKHRAQVAAALGEADARRADRAQAEQVLAATVAQSYFKLQSLWARGANARAQTDTWRAIVADTARRIERGIARSDAQHGAKLELGRLNERAAQLASDAGREREGLRALTGGDSNALAQLAQQPASVVLHALPARLGLELLARRPDLQAARYRVEASLGRVAASKAAFYPDLNLVGAFGLDAISIGKLLRAGSRTLLLASAIELPLFDNGRLGAALDAVRAQRDEMIADYNQSVLNAVRDVAQDGVTLQGIENQLVQHRTTSAASEALLRNVRLRLKQGLADQGELRQAELARLKQQDITLELLQAQRQAEVALNKSLGGGYRAPDARVAATPSSHAQ